MIYDDYINYCEQYRGIYGERTVVLIQVGDFFELYGVQNETETCGADMYVIGDICNLTVTRKNKSILENSRANPLMAGFPLHALTKHTQLLLDNEYTVVIVRQVTPPPNVRREVTEILSPSTTMVPGSTDNNFLLVFQWEKYPNGMYAVGIAGADVSTGYTFAYEIASSTNDPMRVFDEAYRMMQSYQPREVVFTGSDIPSDIESMLSSSPHRVVHKNVSNSKLKPSFQNEILRKSYADYMTSTMLDPIEIVGLERYDAARSAFIALITFLYDHNELIIMRLRLPEILTDDAYLSLEYNSAVQLNVLGCFAGDKPLVALLNKCMTAIGSREFKRRLLAPLTNPSVIHARYDRIDHIMKSRGTHQIRKALRNVGDIERLLRKMELGTLSPIEWFTFHSSLQYVKTVASEYDGDTNTAHIINSIECSYINVLNIEECAKYTLVDLKGNIFHKGIYPDIDELTNRIANAFTTLNDMANEITDCRVDSNERDGYFLQITRKRWDTAVARGLDASRYVIKPISAGSSVLRVTNKDVEECSDHIIYGQKKVATMVIARYKEFLEKFVQCMNHKVRDIVAYVADIDVATNNAFIAAEYGYTRPQLVEGRPASFLDAQELRHPIIEQLSTQVEYVKNNIRLDASGMLLYGINASGKSSLMKAVGLAVIMAQAGMYVAASNLQLSPYRHIFTRILSADNIYRGMSTFVVEMAELRNILQRCDAFSLVLGDELCAGTESVSAIAIVSAGIDVLVKKQSSFIFATHLHEIDECDWDANNVAICHMHIEMDSDTGKIVYDRRIKQGRGNELYGLEVCASLGMPPEFMAKAHSVRKRIQQVPSELVTNKWSRYNKDVCVDVCKVCNERPAEETHHITPQEVASQDGFVATGVRVHRRSNLVPLCKECHLREHHGDLNIRGFIQTSHGIELDIATSVQVPSPPPKDFQQIITQLRRKYEYRQEHHTWFTVGTRRRCKLESIIKYVHKNYKYTLNPEEQDMLSSELASHSYT